MQVIKAGAKGDEVRDLQAKLSQLGFPLKADGQFGPATAAVVEELQATFGYDVDGAVGDATKKLIDAQIGYGFRVDGPDAVKRALEAQGKRTDKGALAGAPLVHALKHGSRGAQVSYLQRRLRALGFELAIDGKYGPETEGAVKRLQEAFGYDVDGVVGEATHRLINAQIGYGWSLEQAKAKPQA
jgi:peptidoglycan hydrolase-like protein with peptidoglycan-binding domain